MEISTEFWRACSTCKKPIKYKTKFYECSVSTCTRRRTGYVFCSVPCWEVHLPGAKHRDAGAIEKVSPSYEQWKIELAEESAHSSTHNSASGTEAPATTTGVRRIVAHHATSSSGATSTTSSSSSGIHLNFGSTAAKGKSSMDHEVLVVVSKMKQYVKDIADMNTSGDVSDVLSDMIRRACDQAVVNARSDGRKTVMARDFK